MSNTLIKYQIISYQIHIKFLIINNNNNNKLHFKQIIHGLFFFYLFINSYYHSTPPNMFTTNANMDYVCFVYFCLKIDMH